MPTAASRTFSVRHAQLARALFAAIAAVMITFSPDHSAAVGLAVFSGFALSTALLLALAAWLVASPGGRWPYVLLAAIGFLAGMASGVAIWRTTVLFFVVVIAWGALSGLVELLAGLRARKAALAAGQPTDVARDHILVGVFGLLLAVAVAVVPAQYAWGYTIEGAGDFVLTGITLAVGIFGLYAAFVAVFLGIAGLSPRAAASSAVEDADAAATTAERGGVA
ncbi:hypothetical protein GCM10025768_03030 [Microbacterium pseudoresistens]|uniref:MFS family permease n=1 Tax=Microbacterium pseudoresistens TaxID=640634 RepID=A0A7Y9EUP7_9MICO|nr:acyl-CoA synthetase [Microbacterium pseudoresistens]NYD54139.1 MFS family permease [Microbacterium pseudoresistens]